jgi:hypothetical protein
MMNYSLALFLEEGKSSLGFYATKSPKNLIVFVNGVHFGESGFIPTFGGEINSNTILKNSRI